ncbi:fungal STAND NTPase-like protein [Microdochium nivale]|nr:fungal STAND NTPase-like protein [Microdochium nivale]
MAEPDGLALGIVSLAIQVCKGIITYADAVRGKTKDLKGLDKKAKGLSRTLETVHKALDCVRTNPTHAQSATILSRLPAITNSIGSCEDDLKELEAFIVKYTDGCLITNPKFRDRCKDAYGTLKFGFRQKEVADMENKLASVNTTLCLGLQSLNIDLSVDQGTQLEKLHDDNLRSSTQLKRQDQTLASVRGNSAETLQRLEDMSKTLDATKAQLIDTIQTQLPTLRTHIDSATTEVVQRFETQFARMEGISVTNHTAVSTDLAVVSTELVSLRQAVEALTADLDGVPGPRQYTQAARRLASRPALLQDTIMHMKGAQANIPGPTSHLADNVLGKWGTCDCHEYRLGRSWEVRWNIAQVSIKNQQIIQHHPQCRYARSAATKTATERSLKLRLKIFDFVINTAFGLSYGAKQGAGAQSISSVLFAHAVVDDGKSPAFRIVTWFKAVITMLEGQERDDVLTIGLQRLHLVFQAHVASPTDTARNGRNLVHSLISQVHNYPRNEPESYAKVIDGLVNDLGVSRTQEDNSGRLPWNAYNMFLRNAAQLPDYVELLLPRGQGATSSLQTLDISHMPDLLSRPGFAYRMCQVYQIDPLSEAIVCNDRARVTTLLRQNPSLLSETPTFAEPTHLHLAVNTRKCVDELLSGILSAAGDGERHASALLELVRTTLGSDGTSLADYSAGSCTWSEGDGQTCQNYSNLAKVLALRSSMRPQHTISLLQCPDCLSVYLQELAHRRKDLENLALGHLTLFQVQEYGLGNGELLDRHVSSVVRSLDQIRVSIPSYMVTADSPSSIVPIWHTLLNIHEEWDGYTRNFVSRDHMDSSTMEALFCAGFKDISDPFPDGDTFLGRVVHHALRCVDGYSEPWSCIWWLLDHFYEPENLLTPWKGNQQRLHQDVNCWSNTNGSTTIAHMVGGLVGLSVSKQLQTYGRYYTNSDKDAYMSVAHAILLLRVVDDSTCLCSPRGRTPFVYSLLGLVSTSDLFRTPQKYAGALKLSMIILGVSWEQWHYEAAFRLFTFEALGMEHTCDRAHEDADSCCSETDDPDPQTSLATILKDIADEFDSIFKTAFNIRLAEPNASEPERMSPLSGTAEDDSDTECESEGENGSTRRSLLQDCPRTEVLISATTKQNWIDLWERRLDDALLQISRSDIDEASLRAAEAIGVVWCEPPPPPPQSRTHDWRERHKKEFWLRNLDDIWKEA